MPEKLQLAPTPYDDEAMSSWIARTALRYGARPTELLDYVGLGSIDVDDRLEPPHIMRLAEVTGAHLRQLTAIDERQRSCIRKPRDLVRTDPETGLRGTICPACIETDVAEGRDQYVRAEWLSVWRISCPAHRCQLRDFELIEMDDGVAAGRSTRWVSCFENAVRPVRSRSYRPIRNPSAAALDAHLLALDQLLSGEDGCDGECQPWSIRGPREHLQDVVWSLVDALCSRPEGGGHVVDYFRDSDDRRRINGGLFTPGFDILPALQANHRAIALAAAAAILLDPAQFQLRAHHGWGHAYMFSLLDLPAERLRRLRQLAKLATKDPLCLVFGIARTPVAETLAEAAQSWAEPLRTRAASAASFALAYRRS